VILRARAAASFSQLAAMARIASRSSADRARLASSRHSSACWRYSRTVFIRGVRLIHLYCLTGRKANREVTLAPNRDTTVAPVRSTHLFQTLGPGEASPAAGAFCSAVVEVRRRPKSPKLTSRQRSAGANSSSALGHRNIQTTIKFYCGLETLQANKQFGNLVRKHMKTETELA
jgi:hypothetical protein